MSFNDVSERLILPIPDGDESVVVSDEEQVFLVFDEEGVSGVVVGVVVVTRKLAFPIHVTPQPQSRPAFTAGNRLGNTENVHLTTFILKLHETRRIYVKSGVGRLKVF